MLPRSSKTEQLIPDSFHPFIGKNLWVNPFLWMTSHCHKNPTATCDLEWLTATPNSRCALHMLLGGCVDIPACLQLSATSRGANCTMCQFYHSLSAGLGTHQCIFTTRILSTEQYYSLRGH